MFLDGYPRIWVNEVLKVRHVVATGMREIHVGEFFIYAQDDVDVNVAVVLG